MEIFNERRRTGIIIPGHRATAARGSSKRVRTDPKDTAGRITRFKGANIPKLRVHSIATYVYEERVFARNCRPRVALNAAAAARAQRGFDSTANGNT